MIVALGAWLLGVCMGAAVVFWLLTSTRIVFWLLTSTRIAP